MNYTTSIRLMRQSGMSVESIAVAMGLTKEDLERLIGWRSREQNGD